jgi:formylglycine-generating enzyme required for sulfatase activity
MTKRHYRLPTEAEWEYAARGGAHRQQDGYRYAGSDKLKEVGWYIGNSDGETKAVGLKYTNELGLYDMSGNVWEWCNDWFDEKYYQACHEKGLVQDPQGPEKGVYRVVRGGGWIDDPRHCRVACRYTFGPAVRGYDLGFRLALSRQLTRKPDGYH